MRSLFLALCVLLCGCGQLSWDIDPAFTSSERQQIYVAMVTWDNASKDWIKDLGANTIHIRRAYRLEANHLGEWHKSTTTIEILPERMNMLFRRTMMHELGHAAGLGHVTDRPSVMQPIIDDAEDAPTPEDVAAL